MIGLHVVLLIVAFLFCLLAGLLPQPLPAMPTSRVRLHLGWIGLALWILDVLVK